MRKLALVMNLALVAGVAGLGVARAQDAADDTEVAKPEERQHIQVLSDPHDIASFYRSSQEQVFYGPLGSRNWNGQAPSRYPIASFYRNEGRGNLYGYSASGRTATAGARPVPSRTRVVRPVRAAHRPERRHLPAGSHVPGAHRTPHRRQLPRPLTFGAGDEPSARPPRVRGPLRGRSSRPPSQTGRRSS